MPAANATPQAMLDMAYALARDPCTPIDINVDNEPSLFIKALTKALVSTLRELAVDLSDRFDDSLGAAHAAAIDALELDFATKMYVRLGNTAPRIRRVVERDTEGRIAALIDEQA